MIDRKSTESLSSRRYRVTPLRFERCHVLPQCRSYLAACAALRSASGCRIYSWSSRWCEFTFRLASAIYERLLSSCPQNATPLDEECAASNVSVGCISTELIQAIIALSSSVA